LDGHRGEEAFERRGVRKRCLEKKRHGGREGTGEIDGMPLIAKGKKKFSDGPIEPRRQIRERACESKNTNYEDKREENRVSR